MWMLLHLFSWFSTYLSTCNGGHNIFMACTHFWVCYLISVVFKITFFVSFHPWKEIIKDNAKTTIKDWGTCCKSTPKKEEHLEIEMEGEDLLDGVKGNLFLIHCTKKYFSKLRSTRNSKWQWWKWRRNRQSSRNNQIKAACK